jgi:hypothetical protein
MAADEKDPPSDDARSEDAHSEDAQEGEEQPDPKVAFKRGMGLLWQAARTVAGDVKREVEKAHVKESLQQAGKEIEQAAAEAAKALESFIGRAGGEPKPDYTDEWPPKDAKPPTPDKTESKQADADIPKDGGKDAKGERRDMRILIDDE